MAQILLILKGLIPVLEPLGESGINQLWIQVDAGIAAMADASDMKLAAQCLSPGVKAFLIAEIKKLAA